MSYSASYGSPTHSRIRGQYREVATAILLLKDKYKKLKVEFRVEIQKQLDINSLLRKTINQKCILLRETLDEVEQLKEELREDKFPDGEVWRRVYV
jgi:hypothetical protein